MRPRKAVAGTKRPHWRDGQKFNKLTILESYTGGIVDDKRVQAKCLCQCECGVQKIIITCYVVNGHNKSCGCALKEHMANYGRRMWRKTKKDFYDRSDQMIEALQR